MNYKIMMEDYEKAYKCIRSCKELKQISSCHKIIDLFQKKHEKKFYLSVKPYTHALNTHLEYQKMKITNYKPQNHEN